MAHSIPDSCGFIIRTPLGPIVHTGDFKLDHTPVMDQRTDLTRLGQIGAEGCLLLMADSTYADTDGYTPSELLVGEALSDFIAKAPGRVIIATFASQIARVQQIVNGAQAAGRKVFVTGQFDGGQRADGAANRLRPGAGRGVREPGRDAPASR
ncbi:MAG: hypothetical protein U5Q44_00945 [Dehalococcoidia bacterium]|nr:hypothetical protein [Dehalococcoidia bacterium]